MLDRVKQYFKPTNEVRKRDILREFIGQGGLKPGIVETAKSLPRDMARFAISAAEVPNTLREGKANGKFYNTPLGRINSFQNEAQNRVNRGDPLWKAIGNPAMDTILAGSDIGSLLGMGARAMRPVSSMARDLTNPMGMPFENALMKTRPGMNVQAIPSKIDDLIRDKKPFHLGGQVSDDMLSELRKRSYMKTMDDSWRYSPTPPQVASMNPRQLNYADMAEIQAPNPDVIASSIVKNRPVAEAIGLQSRPFLGKGAPNKAIRPKDGLATYIPPEMKLPPRPSALATATGMNNPHIQYIPGPQEIKWQLRNQPTTNTGLRDMFSGGVNPGQYAPGDNVFIMSARTEKGYAKPNLDEMVKAIKGKAKTIVTEAASVDAGPVSDVDTAVDRLLVNAGYRTTEPGIWTLSDKKDWMRFARDKAKQVMPSGNIPKIGENLRLPASGYAGPSMLRNGVERPNIQPDFYGSNITDEFLPLWHKKPKR